MDYIALALAEKLDYKFILHGQPILPVHSTEIVNHYELLLRISSPTHGLLYPADFMPSEDYPELLEAIDWWVINQTSFLLSKYPDLKFSINFSRPLLQNPLLLIKLESVFSNNVLDRITFEISERYINWTVEEIETLKSVSEVSALQVDDLGKARLAEILLLPINGFKIDGAIICKILKDKKACVLSKFLIGLAKDLDLNCVCEFVENQEIWDYLKQFAAEIQFDRLFVQGHAVGGYKEFTLS